MASPPASHPPNEAPRERKPDRDGVRGAGGQAGARETGRAVVVNLAPDAAARPHLPAQGPRARETQGARRSCRRAPSHRGEGSGGASPSQRKRRPRRSQVCSRAGQRYGPAARRWRTSERLSPGCSSTRFRAAAATRVIARARLTGAGAAAEESSLPSLSGWKSDRGRGGRGEPSHLPSRRHSRPLPGPRHGGSGC